MYKSTFGFLIILLMIAGTGSAKECETSFLSTVSFTNSHIYEDDGTNCDGSALYSSFVDGYKTTTLHSIAASTLDYNTIVSNTESYSNGALSHYSVFGVTKKQYFSENSMRGNEFRISMGAKMPFIFGSRQEFQNEISDNQMQAEASGSLNINGDTFNYGTKGSFSKDQQTFEDSIIDTQSSIDPNAGFTFGLGYSDLLLEDGLECEASVDFYREYGIFV